MPFDPKIHHRHSIRLPDYDYSQSGAYYLTIVTHGRECLLGVIQNGAMQLNQFGQIVQRAWFDLPNHYPHVTLGAFAFMPNHVHAVILLNDDDRRGGSIGNVPVPDMIISNKTSLPGDSQTRPYIGNVPVPDMIISNETPLPDGSPSRPYDAIKRHPLSEIVRAFKSFSARRINMLRKTPGTPVWQRNYYEHILRNNADYNRIAYYIQSNPANWLEDKEYLGGQP